jgi:hypothetical protein
MAAGETSMTIAELQATLQNAAPPAGLPLLIEAMWWEARGDWERAHMIAQDVPTGDGAWVHAYLHRREGDVANAGYWYRQAGRRAYKGSFAEEWAEIVEAVLQGTGV